MNERFRIARKELRLTMRQVANAIYISESSVSLLESGRNNPSEQTVKLFCSNLGISETWLRTGEGDMLESAPNSLIDQVALKFDMTPLERAVLEAYVGLSPASRGIMRQYMKDVISRAQESEPKLENHGVINPYDSDELNEWADEAFLRAEKEKSPPSHESGAAG